MLRDELVPQKTKDKIIIEDGIKEIIIEGKGYYLKNNTDKRYLLEIDILPNNATKKALTVIMLNPSEYNKKKTSADKLKTNAIKTANNAEYNEYEIKKIYIDQTITNVIKIANDNEYNFLKILNLITTISPNPKNIKRDEKIDVDFLLSEIDDTDTLIAWGMEGNKIINRNNEAGKIIQTLQTKRNIYTFCPNKQLGYPKHPARLNIDCCRNCYGRKGAFTLVEYKSLPKDA